ncbi:MAG: DUF3857 domain-containing protein [Planctomycetes bacterium]|nr:DUF3857 domain-containing protein [Planctomycetota bacterium]
MTRSRLWLIVGVLLAGSAHLHADDWPVPRGASHEPLPYRYDSKVLRTIPRAFLDDSLACVLYSGTTNLIEPDGTVETITHEITRLNSRKGIDKLGEYRSISYEPAYEKLTLNEARIIKADGTMMPIEPRHVQLRDLATDFQVYDQGKQLVISFPNLQVGDSYEVKWTVRGKSKEFDGDFFTRYTFGDDSTPVMRDEFRVKVPKNKSLKHATVNGKVDLVVTDMGGDRFYHWSVSNRPELPRDDDRPSKEELRLQVSVSTFSSWDAVGAWKQKVRKDCWKCTDEIRKIVQDVTRDKATQVEKAKALTYWVRRHIRYLSRGPGGAGYTPHMPHQVLNNLYGDCKDQAQLLAVMLREIGLPVWLVTLGTVDDGQVLPDVPSPWGTHAILLTKIDGKEYWIDTTVSLAAWDFLPRTDRDRQTYLTQEDKLTLLKTPPFTYKDFRIEQTTFMSVQPDGTSRCRRISTYHHSSAWTRRDKWLEVPPGERRRTISAELQDAHSKARLLSFHLDEKELNDFDKPVRAEVNFEIPKHFSGDPAREASVTDSPVWTWFLGYNIDVERQLPFKLPTPFESMHRYVIQLPDAFRFDGLPESRDVKSPFGFFSLKVIPDKADSRRAELHMHMRLEKTRIEKQEFADFVFFQEEVSKSYRAWLNMKPTTSIADAPRLEKLLANEKSADAVSLKILAKLYVDEERLAEARRVLERASALFPSDRAIWEMRVQATANIDDEDRLYREMVKQFPNEPRYAVALGAASVRREDHDEARRILTPLAKHATPSVRAAAHYQLARSADRQNDPAQALKHLQAALLADSSTLASMDALLFRARVQEKLGRVKEAIPALQAAVEADPSARDTLEFLVRLEIRAGMREAALDHLRKFTVAAGKDQSSLVKAADLHLELNRLEDAFELASQARELGFQAKAQRVLGLVHFTKHDYKQAAFHLERCDLDGKALMALLEANLRLGDLDAARRRADTIAKTPDGSSALVALGKSVVALASERERIVMNWKKLDEKQVAAVRRVVGRFLCAERGLNERWPTEQIEPLVESSEGVAFAPAIALRGWLMVDRGQLRKALAEVGAALKVDPKNARALAARGRARLEQGDLESAFADLARAAEFSERRDGIILHWLAAALLDAGRTKEALEMQRLAVTLRPSDPALREQLRRIEMGSE